MEQPQFNQTEENSYKKAPPHGSLQNDGLAFLNKAINAYKFWNETFRNLEKLARFSIGIRIDNLFLDFVEKSYFAIYASRFEKKKSIEDLSKSLDALKLNLKIAWEIKAIDNKKYASISIPLMELGKIIGGWKKIF
ncbi:MAG: four helix bundle protein [Candidatus Pacebacteria bacterium]|nr:four helix bundle protein [Candidatus Paceibacterota bacterium]